MLILMIVLIVWLINGGLTSNHFEWPEDRKRRIECYY